MHRHPAFWDAPGEYRPERFLPRAAADRPSHLYIPFGGGPRICLGQAFALTEATLVLATVLPRVRLRPVPGHVVEPEALVTLRPRHGLLMTAQAVGA
jgi:cytochrome P450